jgi:hypothetical protein
MEKKFVGPPFARVEAGYKSNETGESIRSAKKGGGRRRENVMRRRRESRSILNPSPVF